MFVFEFGRVFEIWMVIKLTKLKGLGIPLWQIKSVPRYLISVCANFDIDLVKCLL
jgi:hypothetical protein